MNVKHIYSGKSSYEGRVVVGQLIVIKGKNGIEHYYIAEENEIDTHSFYAVNPDAFVEVLPESIFAVGGKDNS